MKREILHLQVGMEYFLVKYSIPVDDDDEVELPIFPSVSPATLRSEVATYQDRSRPPQVELVFYWRHCPSQS